MTDSTPTAWTVDGTSLQTLCQNVVSLAPKYGIPGLRGDDTSIAYRRGKQWRRKYVDSRTETLGMWVTGMLPDGTKPPNGLERQFHQNMTTLQNLLWHDGERQVVLTKKWVDPLTGTVLSANALAEPQDWIPEMQGPYSAKMTVDFLLADPYYYGPLVDVSIPFDTDTPIAVAGDVATSRMTLTFNGDLANPILTNSTPEPDVWVRIGSEIASGDEVLLNVEDFVAVRQSDDANVVGSVTRSGARNWMRLWPGSNTLRLTATSGSGTVDLSYAPAYL